jgi:hypothetical protein
MPDILAEDPLKQEPKSGQKQNPTGNDGPERPSSDFAALIDAITTEGRAYRKEEQREDRGKKIREWITIILIGMTFCAVCYQVYEMIKVYEPIREQAVASGKQAIASEKAADATTRAADAATKQSEIATKQAENSDKALIQAQRAWVGPRNASFSAEPKVGEPVDITIDYQNTGREPALSFSYEADIFAIAEQSPDFGMRVVPFMNKCLGINTATPGQVVYPSTGFSQYNLTAKTNKDLVDDPVVAGDKVVVV